MRSLRLRILYGSCIAHREIEASVIYSETLFFCVR